MELNPTKITSLIGFNGRITMTTNHAPNLILTLTLILLTNSMQ